MVKTKPFDAAEVLDSPEMIAAYLRSHNWFATGYAGLPIR
jgi:DNA-binding phage protein